MIAPALAGVARTLRFAVGCLIGVGPVMVGLAAETPTWLTPVLSASTPPRPDAAAVVLLADIRVDYLPEGKQVVRERRVFRLLSPDGAREAIGGCTYNADTDHVRQAKAWIISTDGTNVVPCGRKEFADVVVLPNDYEWNSRRIFAFSAGNRLAVGGVVAWEVEIERSAAINDFSCALWSEIPIARATIEVTPRAGEKLGYYATSDLIPAPQPGTAPGSLRWEMLDLPGKALLPPTGFIPNRRAVFVHATSATADTWAGMVERIRAIVEPRIEVAPSVANRARALVKGVTGHWPQVRVLADEVQHNISYLSVAIGKDSLAGMRPRPPADVLQSRYGDCKDKATLLVAMLREIGVTAYPMVVRAADPTHMVPDWPWMDFNHMIVAIPADAEVPTSWPVIDGGPLGRLVVFDPTSWSVPLGVLEPSDQGAEALILGPGVGGTSLLPPERPEHVGLNRTIRGRIDPDGVVDVSVDERLIGTEAARIHGDEMQSGKEKAERNLADWLHSTLPLSTGLKLEQTWDEGTSGLARTYHFVAPRAVRPFGRDRLLVQPRLIGGDAKFSPWSSGDEGWVWLRSGRLDEEVRLQLPAGAKVESLPADWTLAAGDCRVTLHYQLDGETLIFRREHTFGAHLYNRVDYAAWRRFIEKMNEAERRPAIVRMAEATVGSPGAAAGG